MTGCGHSCRPVVQHPIVVLTSYLLSTSVVGQKHRRVVWQVLPGIPWRWFKSIGLSSLSLSVSLLCFLTQSSFPIDCHECSSVHHPEYSSMFRLTAQCTYMSLVIVSAYLILNAANRASVSTIVGVHARYSITDGHMP